VKGSGTLMGTMPELPSKEALRDELTALVAEGVGLPDREFEGVVELGPLALLHPVEDVASLGGSGAIEALHAFRLDSPGGQSRGVRVYAEVAVGSAVLSVVSTSAGAASSASRR
jgi:hypothetical protein